MQFRGFAALVMAGALAACSMGKDVPVAEQATKQFHAMLNAGQSEAIYKATAPGMKAATSQGDFVKLLDAVHRKLGAFQSGETQGWNDAWNNGRHLITLNYHAKYARGEANETFVYHITDHKAALYGYNVNSNALIEN
ncbi:hypothetical protein GCM10023219_01820 [Stakelama sediminis]|uniref:DUF4019 domain-containing protein n=1 Tax=Stakelama sediminis TaxID=463200 RepID=A0A840Z0S6_9SPHN|nr:hypothetical protein [Stakelama sediminis]MBB5719379.1 hypothetical protein [Stakelama sediminis]